MTTGWLQMLLMVIIVTHIAEVPAIKHEGKLNMIQRYLVVFFIKAAVLIAYKPKLWRAQYPRV